MSNEINHDAIAQDMFGVFEQTANEVKLDKGEVGGSVMFNPNAKDAEEQTWRGVVKFLPNLNSEGMSNHIIKKVSYWIPIGESGGVRWDSPRSIGEKCLVNDKYWELKNSKNAKLQAKANLINYQPRTFALIQIIKDFQDPTQEGKIKVWALPQAIEKKINEQMYPTKKDVDMGAEANNVFNPLNGFPMILKISVKTAEINGKTSQFRDYDSCAFKATPMSVIIEGEKLPVEISKASSDNAIKTQILETIKNGANLQTYAYKEPTEKEENEVKAALEALVTGEAVKVASDEVVETKEETKAEVKAEKQEKEVREAEPKAKAKAEAKAEPKTDKKAELTPEEIMMRDLGMGDDI